jgi:inner membrane protein
VTTSTIEPRTRGIYQVNTFQSKNTLQASWAKPNFTRARQSREASAVEVVEMAASNSVGAIQTVCGQTDLVVQIQDLRGVRDLAVQVNGQTYVAETGLIENEKQGISVRLNSAHVKASSDFKVSIDLGLVGIESLDIIPHAAQNTVQMQGNWPHRSFTGVLPDKRNITDKGFEATWSSSSYGIAAKHSAASADRIGVAFIDPINAYTQTDRAIKYGLLFIVLTFVAVGLFEVTKKLQVHPVQYLLVGSAVTIFFLLLLSLGEHLSFPFAYVLAATACVGLLTFYASHILGGLLRGTPFGGLMTVLYGMIYVLLSLEQTALLIGSLALFGALTAVMVLTRKVNWYELGK